MSKRLPAMVLSGSAERDISYAVTFEILNHMDESASRELDSVVAVFSRAGRNGGFADPNVSPSETRLTVVSHTSTPQGRFAFHLTADFVDPRAFQLLRNMSVRLKRQSINVTRITVKGTGQIEHPLIEVKEPTEDDEFEVYPEISSKIGIEVEGEESDFSKTRRCLVEMHNPIEASHVLSMGDWIQPWYLLLEGGAFAMPVGPPDEIDSFRGTVTIFDEITVEISVDRFLASETAWNVLVNLLDAYSCINSPISRVIVD